MIRHRSRGTVAHVVVIAFTIVVASLVLASQAKVGSFRREVARTTASDQAFALAEAGIRLIRTELAAGKTPGPATFALGAGQVRVEPEGPGTWVATGTVAAPLVAGQDGRAIRKVRATFASAPGRPATIVAWKEL